jgi:peroxiredoxin
VGETLQTINDDYNRTLLQIEKQRLDRLGQLAARQTPRDAAETYETLFRLAIANNLFVEAEPAAQRILKAAGSPSPTVRFLAHTIKIIAAADRGAYDESLADLRKHIGPGSEPDGKAEASAVVLDTPSLLAILGAYYQRLVQGGRFDVARKAFQLIHDETSNPAVKEFCSGRLNQLSLVGKPAPPIQGTDVDGKPLNLADLKGNVVLVVFWASWCIPNAAEIAWLDELYNTYRHRGFRIVGINLDTLQSGDPKLEVVMPNIRRFLMDHNVRWPNLINGAGANDHAKAYGVTEIPSNVLIGPDGTVIHVDLSRKNLGPVVAKALPKP